MNTNQKSSFAAGLLVATVICGSIYFLEPNQVSSVPTIESPSEAEIKESLTTAGYVILTEQEWEEQLAIVEAAEVEEEDPEVTESSTDTSNTGAEQEAVASLTILNVASGMTSFDVGKVLVTVGITDSAMSFVQEVEKRGVSNRLRPGTYEISSDMTVDQVISIVFK
ncbi:hypothetical protein JOC85_002959 [Bacillus mesophilus]|uniref:Endolytic transglycosylase MltG n=1 Tax=Bacillus mesophilus TaxID=1808955 RepID=A0A6M0Q805_9BACI|nr:endolytic transglycosylase MltG [Bacillus mesophilus]MBM7662152.1 hypothetical protein [Bacillus mesophilus]NEY72496.1 endolytic transglycosylase MltG [Bacillus mesophilus]